MRKNILSNIAVSGVEPFPPMELGAAFVLNRRGRPGPARYTRRGTMAQALTKTKTAVLLAFAGSMCSASAFAGVLYVNATAAHGGTGATWSAAFRDLQSALAVAGSGDEIWVARGTYRPAVSPANNGRAASFALRTGVGIYGGFVGTETTRQQRDWIVNPTILSGDLLGDDGENWTNRTDNSFQVVTAVNLGHCTLDGVTVSGGHADGVALGATPASQDQGSGMNVYDSWPQVSNVIFERNYAVNHGAFNDHGNSTLVGCTFRYNYAGMLGAGLYMHFEAATSATNCVFTYNETPEDGAGVYTRSYVGSRVTDSTFTLNAANHGASVYVADGSNPTIADCTFTSNTAFNGGAGVFSKFAFPTVQRCTFTGNEAGLGDLTGAGGGGGSGGGGFWASGGNPLVEDCTFTGNSATFGAGVYFNEGSVGQALRCRFTDNLANEAGGLYALLSDVTVINCTFISNTATGGQFPVGGGMSAYFANVFVTGCTLDGNSAGLGGGGMYVEGETPLITASVFTRNYTTWDDQGWGGGLLMGFHTTGQIVSSVFVGNTAQRGGGIASAVLAEPQIINCTIVGNTSTAADARGGGIHTLAAQVPTVANTVVWGNAPFNISGPMDVSYSVVQGGAAGTGNISDEPRLMRYPSAGADGTWGTADDDLGDLRLLPGSVCIDAGDSNAVPARALTDVAGLARISDDPSIAGQSPAAPVDIGAHEFAGVSCPQDFDGDGDAGTDTDIEQFFRCLAGDCCDTCKGTDFDNDGDAGTDADIESFFRVLAGGGC